MLLRNFAVWVWMAVGLGCGGATGATFPERETGDGGGGGAASASSASAASSAAHSSSASSSSSAGGVTPSCNADSANGSRCLETCLCPPCGTQSDCSEGFCVDSACAPLRPVRCRTGSGLVYQACSGGVPAREILWDGGDCQTANDVGWCAPGDACHVVINGNHIPGVCE